MHSYFVIHQAPLCGRVLASLIEIFMFQNYNVYIKSLLELWSIFVYVTKIAKKQQPKTK